MFEGLKSFLMVISMVLLRGGRATNMFVVGGEAASVEGREEGLDVIVFEVMVKG